VDPGHVVQKVRDLVLIRGTGGQVAVVACDSAGGIGPKDLDVVRVPGYVLGRFTSRVALMEVLASGAVPAVLVSTLCAEPDPVGLDVTRGIIDELQASGLQDRVTITGSAEKNIATRQTGLGITVIGFAGSDELRLGASARDDEVLCVGVPKVGTEVRLEDTELADTASLTRLLGVIGVHEVVPAGSRGILHEAGELARHSGLSFRAAASPAVDVRKSAGPATCLVVSAVPGLRVALASMLSKPVFHVGWLR